MGTADINKCISLINENHEKICLFLGAGVDISSGGPSFNKLKDSIISRFSEFSPYALNTKNKDDLFEDIIDSVSQYNSREIFQNEINGRNHKISDGYKILLLLTKYNFVDTIITTNYFGYLEEAQQETNEYQYNIYINNDEKNNYSDNLKPLYIKLHGDANRHNITHVTNDEIDKKPYTTQTEELFVSQIKNKTLIFIGYSGNDAMVTEIINENIDCVKSTYWISPAESDSPLVNCLKAKNKYYFCKATFDDFMVEWGIPKLSHIKLMDSNPIFIASLLDSKAEQSTNDIRNQNKIFIERKDVQEQLDFLNQVGFLYGKAGVGKTSVLHNFIISKNKNQILYVDLKNNQTINAINVVIEALGFYSNSPFAFLHRLCLWYESQKKYITFIIDGIIKYDRNIDEMLLLTKLNENNKYVSFIYSSRVKYENEVCNINEPSDKAIEVCRFNKQDILKMKKVYCLENYVSEDYTPLMEEPYICSIICEYFKKGKRIKTTNVFEAIEAALEEKYNISAAKIHALFIKIAASHLELDYTNDFISEEMKPLSESELFNTEPLAFKHEKMLQYYLYCYLSRTPLLDSEFVSEIKENINDTNKIDSNLYEAYKYHFTKCNTICEIQDSLIKLNELLHSSAIPSKSKVKFARECIKKIIITNEDLFTDALCKFSPDIMCDDLKYIIITTVNFMESHDSAFRVWGHFSSEQKFSYSVFIFYFDRLSKLLFNCSDKNELEEYYQYLRIYSERGKNLNVIIPLYILMRFDTSDEKHKDLTEYLLDDVKNLITSQKDECKSSILSVLRKYSYNILFNSGNDIDGDYTKIPYDECFIHIVDSVLSGNFINQKELHYLVTNQDISNNMILFLLYNLAVTCSLCNNREETLASILGIIRDSSDLHPENVDFILSCSFMALYHENPLNRKEFTSIFEEICSKFETRMFEQPSNDRKSTICKFSEEFDKLFEDGFNPTAFLFYTAPSDKSGDALKKYSELCEMLYESGNHSKILKIVHAVGQMISIYPNEGFAELSKLLKYDEKIIRKGIIRILAENMQRYPYETEKFIADSNETLSCNEQLEVWGTSSRFLENRTLEQLHWSRLLYALSYNNNHFIKNILSNFRNSKTLSDFVSLMLEEQVSGI